MYLAIHKYINSNIPFRNWFPPTHRDGVFSKGSDLRVAVLVHTVGSDVVHPRISKLVQIFDSRHAIR